MKTGQMSHNAPQRDQNSNLFNLQPHIVSILHIYQIN